MKSVNDTHFSMYENVFNSEELFSFNFLKELNSPLDSILVDYIISNFSIREETEFGNVYTHKYKDFYIDFFFGKNSQHEMFIYTLDNGNVNIKKTFDRIYPISNLNRILKEYYKK